MDSKWQRHKILIWGKTRPEISKTYREIVCTGGILETTKRIVRIYPIPLRYLDDEKLFSKYQWIEAYIRKSTSDPRPESFKIRYEDIVVHEKIEPGKDNWDARAEWVLQPNNVFQSVEAIQEQQKIDRTSLGLIKPSRVISIKSEKLPQSESRKFWDNYQHAIAQMDLPMESESRKDLKPLRPPDYKFKIEFCCDDERCLKSHKFSVLDWEFDALYFRCVQRGDSPELAAEKVVEKLVNQVCAPDKDLYFFIGNIATHPQVFTIVGLWWPKKKKQPKLFE